jgi:hypothetical protein
MKLRVAPLLAMFKEGIYPAVVEKLEVDRGNYGEYLRWTFAVGHQRGIVSFTGLTSTTFNMRSKLFKWASAVLGRTFEDHEELDTDTLLIKACRVYLVIKELDEGGSLNQVERVLAVDDERDNDRVSGAHRLLGTPGVTGTRSDDDDEPPPIDDDIPF